MSSNVPEDDAFGVNLMKFSHSYAESASIGEFKQYRWVGSTEVIDAFGITVGGGFFYFGNDDIAANSKVTREMLFEKVATQVDEAYTLSDLTPLYIDSTNIIINQEFNNTENISDYFIKPSSKLSYLQWLASDRSCTDDTYDSILLYIKGFERRIYNEFHINTTDEIKAILVELKRLMEAFESLDATSKIQVNELPKYVENIVLHILIMVRITKKTNIGDEYFSILSVSNLDFLRFKLAYAHSKSESISADDAFCWGYFTKGVISKSTMDEYADKLYTSVCEVFEAKYKDGFFLNEPHKKPFAWNHDSLNTNISVKRIFTHEFKDVFQFQAYVAKIRSLFRVAVTNISIDDNHGGEIGINGFPSVGEIDSAFRNNPTKRGTLEKISILEKLLDKYNKKPYGMIDFSTLWEAIEGKSTEELVGGLITRDESNTLSSLIENSSFISVPGKWFNIQFKPDMPIFIAKIKLRHFNDLAIFDRALFHIQLASTIALENSETIELSRAHLYSIIKENEKLNSCQKNALLMYADWALTIGSTRIIKLSIKKSSFLNISLFDRTQIKRSLLGISLFKGEINPESRKALEYLYSNMKLSIGILNSDIKNSKKLLAIRENTGNNSSSDENISTFTANTSDNSTISRKARNFKHQFIDNSPEISFHDFGLGQFDALGETDIHVRSETYLHIRAERYSKKQNKKTISPKKPIYVDLSDVTDEVRAFTINHDLVAKYESDTAESQKMLADIFSDSGFLNQEDVFQPTSTISDDTSSLENDIMEGLNKGQRALLEYLLKEEQLPKSIVSEYCRKNGLLMSGTIESINDWSSNIVGAPIIDDNDSIQIDKEIYQEIVDHHDN
jgi:hypothetical protein